MSADATLTIFLQQVNQLQRRWLGTNLAPSICCGVTVFDKPYWPEPAEMGYTFKDGISWYGNLYQERRSLVTQAYRPGDCVIYRKPKHSQRPGPRARAVDPAPRGDSYTYCVDKFWMVRERLDDVVVLVTRRGKSHSISVEDPNLRRATWWERMFYRRRFPTST